MLKKHTAVQVSHLCAPNGYTNLFVQRIEIKN